MYWKSSVLAALFFFVEVEQVTTKTQKQSVKAKNTVLLCYTYPEQPVRLHAIDRQ